MSATTDKYHFMRERHIERKADPARRAYITCPDEKLEELIVDMGKPDVVPVVMTGQGDFVRRWPR